MVRRRLPRQLPWHGPAGPGAGAAARAAPSAPRGGARRRRGDRGVRHPVGCPGLRRHPRGPVLGMAGRGRRQGRGVPGSASSRPGSDAGGGLALGWSVVRRHPLPHGTPVPRRSGHGAGAASNPGPAGGGAFDPGEESGRPPPSPGLRRRLRGGLARARVAGSREPYRRLARLIHLLARPLPDSPESLEMIQARSFAAASATTLDSWPPQKALSGPELAAFLEEPRYAAVTTTRAGGRPHATMTAYRVRDGRLWLPAVSGAVRLRNLAHEPSATVLVAEGGGEEHVVVMVEGDAVVHDDPQAILSAWLQDEWRRAYGTVLDWAGRIIELVPSKVLSYAATPRS